MTHDEVPSLCAAPPHTAGAPCVISAPAPQTSWARHCRRVCKVNRWHTTALRLPRATRMNTVHGPSADWGQMLLCSMTTTYFVLEAETLPRCLEEMKYIIKSKHINCYYRQWQQCLWSCVTEKNCNYADNLLIIPFKTWKPWQSSLGSVPNILYQMQLYALNKP